MRHFALLIFVLAWSAPIEAASPGPGARALRFQFLPITSERKFGHYIRGSTNQSDVDYAPCAENFEKYLRYRAEGNWGVAEVQGLSEETRYDNAYTQIYNTSNCILESLSPMEAQQIQSAAVLLGLTPILCSTLGATISEIGLVSIRRPLLGMFLSIGTVITWPSRVLSGYDDRSNGVLGRIPGPSRTINAHFFDKKKPTLLLVAIGLVQYLLAIAAAINIFFTSWSLAVASVISLESTVLWWLPAWSATPLFGFLTFTAAIHITYAMRRRTRVSRDADDVPKSSSEPSRLTVYADGQTARYSTVTMNFLPSRAHPEIPTAVLEYFWLTEIAHNVATVFAFVQILLGTLIFSSLLFVAAADAAIIMLRYAASIFICRLIIAVELGGMRRPVSSGLSYVAVHMSSTDGQAKGGDGDSHSDGAGSTARRNVG